MTYAFQGGQCQSDEMKISLELLSGLNATYLSSGGCRKFFILSGYWKKLLLIFCLPRQLLKSLGHCIKTKSHSNSLLFLSSCVPFAVSLFQPMAFILSLLCSALIVQSLAFLRGNILMIFCFPGGWSWGESGHPIVQVKAFMHMYKIRYLAKFWDYQQDI